MSLCSLFCALKKDLCAFVPKTSPEEGLVEAISYVCISLLSVCLTASAHGGLTASPPHTEDKPRGLLTLWLELFDHSHRSFAPQ